jgi:hypothetical protein
MADQELEPHAPQREACRQFDRDLPAYLEGEEIPAVPNHAKECPFCAVVLADLEQIRFATHHLPQEEPPARLWANIRANLEAEGIICEQIPAWQRWLPRPVFFPRSAPLGALAALALFSVTLLLPPRGINQADQPGAPGPAIKTTEASVVSMGLDENLVRTLSEMEKTYQAQEDLLEPTIKDSYRKSLHSLDTSIEECLRHCQKEPGNTLARQYLVRAYQTKAEVLASALEFSGR